MLGSMLQAPAKSAEFRGQHTHLRFCLGSFEFGDIAPTSRLCLPEWPWLRRSAVLSGIQITERRLEERCRTVRAVNIETRRWGRSRSS
jgi:hypothetical protein